MRLKKSFLSILVLLLAIGITSFFCAKKIVSDKKPSIFYSRSLTANCIRVIDGKTIVIDIMGTKEKVMLIGVDTPEARHPKQPAQYFGEEASAFTVRMVEGKKVRLEFDWYQRDKDKRLLAYVYLEDGTFLNAEIVKQGYGHAHTKFPFKYMQEFRQYEKEAQLKKRGLWK